MQKRPADRWGVLVFKGDDDRDLLHVPLAGWLPEARGIGALDLRPQKCLSRTGLRELVERLGIPLEESPELLSVSGVPDDGGEGRPYRAVYAELPRWHAWVRGIGLFGWFIVLVIGFATQFSWALPVAAGFLFLLPAADAVVRIQAWWRNRQHRGLVEKTEIRPSPAAGSGGTRRFLRTASLCVLAHDLVLINALGEERWLGRTGAHGVARLVRLVDPATDDPLGVEVRDGKGEARALLPWRFWFAGPQGGDGWAALVGALGVPVSDEKYQQSEATQPWWQGHQLTGDARKMSPMEGKAARKQVGWYRSVVGANEPVVLPFFSAVLLFGLFSDVVPAFLAGLLSALTIVLSLGPATASALISRISYDRTVEAAHG
ncbi:hypothetical protein ABZ173_07155 [Streptomyces rochei]|uniref:Uncharacterized protein n=1 Tax=Streptomyces vinaceusdrappus TaxID=67376 RepID=A0ABY6C311_9ACTN|nr:hypothetical protein [Streptomyces vinaceusdrappus]UXI80181.1 hypothetical protein N6Q81_20230 [Streptomyces vinaceusdrappus]